jgi:ribose 1,5-bisphosphokinase
MEAMAAARPGTHLVRRVITRPSDAGGEVFDGVSEDAFEELAQAGHFALHWRAHGLRYGVPVSEVAPAGKGTLCLVNLSRSVLVEAEKTFDRFVTLLLSAPVDTLAQRLAARGRESAEEIQDRLSRAEFALPDGLEHVLRIANDGPLEVTVAAAFAALQADKV